MHKLYLYTNDYKYHERFIVTALNAYYGSLNFHNQSSTDYPNTKLSPLPFDSYSPLVYGKRGIATGGLNFMKDGSFYGCCTCIGSAGIGLLGLDCVLEDEKTIGINDYFAGQIKTEDCQITIKGDYLRKGQVHLDIDSKKDIILNIPSWSKATIIVNKKEIEPKDNSIIIGHGKLAADIDFHPIIKTITIGDKTAYKFGYIVLGLDEKDNPGVDLTTIEASYIKDFKLMNNHNAEIVAFQAKYKDQTLLFKDYASCGKYWDLNGCYMTAFVKRGKYE